MRLSDDERDAVNDAYKQFLADRQERGQYDGMSLEELGKELDDLARQEDGYRSLSDAELIDLGFTPSPDNDEFDQPKPDLDDDLPWLTEKDIDDLVRSEDGFVEYDPDEECPW